jgi:hypothetical protein
MAPDVGVAGVTDDVGIVVCSCIVVICGMSNKESSVVLFTPVLKTESIWFRVGRRRRSFGGSGLQVAEVL